MTSGVYPSKPNLATSNWMELNLSPEETEFVADAAKLYKTLYVESLDAVFKIARAIEIISKRHRNSGIQGDYAEALVQYGFTSRDGGPMNKAIRSAHKTLLDNEQQVRAWWGNLPEQKKRDWVSAKTICTHWKRSQLDPNRPKKPSPYLALVSTNATLREQLRAANAQVETLRAADGGSLFDPELSTPEQIAGAYREAWRMTPSKLEKLIRALRAEYKDLQALTKAARPAKKNARRLRA
jgi:hypothetical protein